MREVAGHEWDRVQQVWDWPLREIMLAYVECMKVSALRSYETQLKVWSSLAPYQKRKSEPPAIPRILR